MYQNGFRFDTGCDWAAAASQGPGTAVPAQIGDGGGRYVDAPKGLGRRLQGVEDGGSNDRRMSNGDGVAGVATGGEPAFDAEQQGVDRLATVRGCGGVGEPLGQAAGFDLLRRSSRPHTEVEFSQVRAWQWVQTEGGGGLSRAQFGSGFDLLGPDGSSPKRAQFHQSRGLDWLIKRERGCPSCGGWRVADEGDATGQISISHGISLPPARLDTEGGVH